MRNKLILLFVSVALAAALAVSFVASRIFIRDKRDYLADLNASGASVIASSVARELDHVQSELELFDLAAGSETKLGRSILAHAAEKDDGLVGLELYQEGKLLSRARPTQASSEADVSALLKLFAEKGSRLLVRQGPDFIFVCPVGSKVYLAWLNAGLFKRYFDVSGPSQSALISETGEAVLQGAAFQGPLVIPPDLLSSLKFREKQVVTAKELKTVAGGTVLVAVAPIRDTAGTAVVSQASTSKIGPVLKRIGEDSLPAVFGILFFSSLLAIFFSSSVVKPIKELTEVTSQVGTGHWVVSIKGSSHDEVGHLIAAFKKMGRALARRDQLLKDAQDDLLRAERLATLGKFGAGIAHEVKNPLNTIMGYAQLLQMQKNAESSAEQTQRYLKFIIDETWRANNIISDLLAFARQKPLQLTPVRLNDFLGYVYELSRPAAEKAGVTLSNRESFYSGTVELDRDQMIQVFTNIINNALQAFDEFKPEGGPRVVIQTAVSEASVTISVKDNGPGISKENAGRIFEPFFTTKKVGKGTGLGLSLCLGIVQQHRGTIEVVSEPGQGTIFLVSLPLPSNQARSSIQD